MLVTLKAITGIGDLAFDANGDVGIRYGSALALAKRGKDSPNNSRSCGTNTHSKIVSPEVV